ncbi:hypothetical protein TNCT_665781 [Trichonephila clavata]|uniref:Uncharacterized protein n=1 Tax=Trichonephila clavata TaxID=2740835 RepID=A0A8X6EYY9_TRICU|nr:hypothetical protein TNCT_665781 [Trichonephila clavata]
MVLPVLHQNTKVCLYKMKTLKQGTIIQVRSQPSYAIMRESGGVSGERSIDKTTLRMIIHVVRTVEDLYNSDATEILNSNNSTDVKSSSPNMVSNINQTAVGETIVSKSVVQVFRNETCV